MTKVTRSNQLDYGNLAQASEPNGVVIELEASKNDFLFRIGTAAEIATTSSS